MHYDKKNEYVNSVLYWKEKKKPCDESEISVNTFKR